MKFLTGSRRDEAAAGSWQAGATEMKLKIPEAAVAGRIGYRFPSASCFWPYLPLIRMLSLPFGTSASSRNPCYRESLGLRCARLCRRCK